jgi:hypothetical protein
MTASAGVESGRGAVCGGGAVVGGVGITVHPHKFFARISPSHTLHW